MPQFNTNAPTEADTAIHAEEVSVRRGTTTIVNGVSCHVRRGEIVALLGPNGCGKTTFARTLTGHMFLTEGRLNVLGQTLGQTDIWRLRQRIGLVNPTVDPGPEAHVSGALVDASLCTLDVVCTGYFATVTLYEQPSSDQREHARHMLEQVGLGHRIEHRFETLSTGERRRAIIARSLVSTPELLILDEPTSGLDVAGREQVLATIEMLLSLEHRPAVLMITHHVEELSPKTTQVFLMRDGRFIASGSPQEVITPESLSRTFGCKVFVRRLHGRYWLEVLPEAWLDLIPR